MPTSLSLSLSVYVAVMVLSLFLHWGPCSESYIMFMCSILNTAPAKADSAPHLSDNSVCTYIINHLELVSDHTYYYIASSTGLFPAFLCYTLKSGSFCV